MLASHIEGLADAAGFVVGTVLDFGLGLQAARQFRATHKNSEPS